MMGIFVKLDRTECVHHQSLHIRVLIRAVSHRIKLVNQIFIFTFEES